MDGTSEEDPMRLPLDRFCNWVIAWWKARVRPSDFEFWKFQIDVPPEGLDPATGPWSDNEMAKGWGALNG